MGKWAPGDDPQDEPLDYEYEEQEPEEPYHDLDADAWKGEAAEFHR